MEEFLRFFAEWLTTNKLLPREVTVADKGSEREDKTYLMNLPEDVANCFCVRQYNQRVHTLVAKDACVRYIQIIARNTSHVTAMNSIEKIYNFLINRPELIEDVNGRWMIIDCCQGPTKMKEDSQGNYLYSISFPVTTKS